MEQECIPVGCVPSAAGGCLPRGVSAQGVWCIPACTGADPPCEQNDRQV